MNILPSSWLQVLVTRQDFDFFVSMPYYNQITVTKTVIGDVTTSVITLDFLDSVVIIGGIILFFVLIKTFGKIIR